MLDCLILGDSIAVGVGQARPGCTTVARVGIGSGSYLQSLFPAAPKAASHVVISLGVNDDPAANTADNLRRLRRGVVAGRVTWLLPGLKAAVRDQIRIVAAEHGDLVVDTISQVGADHLHPAPDGYRRIAAWTEQGGPPQSLAAAVPQPQPRRVAVGPVLIPMPGRTTVPAGPLPVVHTPSAGSIYGAVGNGPFAAIPPRDFAFRAFAHALPLPARGM